MTTNGFSIQFHALPEEGASLLEGFLAEKSVLIVAVTFQQFEARLLDRAAISGAFSDPSVDRLVLTVTQPDLSGAGMNALLDKNADVLVWDIGKLREEGLGESCVSTLARGEPPLAAWRSLGKRLRSATRTGVVAVNPGTGATGVARGHRFTAGAKALEVRGVPMLPVAGTSRLMFAD